tara:strand:- start:724 stop:855 length:132 start_codon:yes stop_codon:yes gene_type:complete
MSEEEFEIYFAGCNWGSTFELFPKLEKITYDPEFLELEKNDKN